MNPDGAPPLPPQGGVLPASKRLLTVVLLLAGLLALLPSGAVAQDDPPPRLSLRIQSVEATLVAGGEEPATVELVAEAGGVARTDLRLVATLFGRVTSSDALDQALAGDADAVLGAVATDLDDLGAGLSRVQRLQLTPADLGLDDPDATGVYPLQLRVFQDGESVGVVSTALIVLPPPPLAERLPASLVVGVVADTVPLADDQIGPDLDQALAPGSSLLSALRDLRTAAADGSAAGLTLTLSGRLLEDVADVADGYVALDGTVRDAQDRVARRASRGLEDLRAVLQRGDTSALALPYGPADLVALVRGGEKDEAIRLVDIGRQVVRQTTAADPDPGILVPPDGVDGDTMAALGATDPSALLLDARYLAFADTDRLQPLRRIRTADGGEVRVLVPDEQLSALLRDPRRVGTAAVVQRVLATSALEWFAGPEDAAGLLLRLDVPSDAPVGVIDAVSDAIDSAAWLRPMSLAALAERVRPSERVTRLAYPPSSRAAELDDDYIARLGAARNALVPLRSLLPATDDDATRLGRSLLVAGSVSYRPPSHRDAGLSRITGVLQRLSSLAGAVSVVETPPITLTSATGEVPISLQNLAEEPLTVEVQVGSTGFEFDRDTELLVLPARSVQTVTFRARALNPGGIAGVGVAVTDPSGRLTLVSATLAVRSTAFPVVAVVATVGGLVFLLVWGTRQGRRRRTTATRAPDAVEDSVA